MIQADYPSYATAAQTLAAGDLSVVARVVSSRVEVGDLLAEPGAEPNPHDSEPLILPSTVYTVEVDAVLKGDVKPGQTLEFSILGGAKDGECHRLDGAPTLPEGTGERYLFSLAAGGTYASPINLREGVLKVEQGDVVPVPVTDLPAVELAALAESVAAADRQG